MNLMFSSKLIAYSGFIHAILQQYKKFSPALYNHQSDLPGEIVKSLTQEAIIYVVNVLKVMVHHKPHTNAESPPRFPQQILHTRIIPCLLHR
jgi:hypothetical protein